MKRRVSRVESLRNLFFNRGGGGDGGGGANGARRRFISKKRARSAEKDSTEKVNFVVLSNSIIGFSFVRIVHPIDIIYD